VPGDPVLLKRLIANLASNAITYNANRSGWATGYGVAAGVGLGLAIVGAHQGTLHARPRAGGVLIVTVELPRQP
jgi:signal transduction histidine kinase